MNILNYFIRKKTAGIARDRLHIIIAQAHRAQSQDFLPLLRQEILKVVAKYTKADINKVQVDLHVKNNSSILELNVVLPEKEKDASTA